MLDFLFVAKFAENICETILKQLKKHHEMFKTTVFIMFRNNNVLLITFTSN